MGILFHSPTSHHQLGGSKIVPDKPVLLGQRLPKKQVRGLGLQGWKATAHHAHTILKSDPSPPEGTHNSCEPGHPPASSCTRGVHDPVNGFSMTRWCAAVVGDGRAGVTLTRSPQHTSFMLHLHLVAPFHSPPMLGLEHPSPALFSGPVQAVHNVL